MPDSCAHGLCPHRPFWIPAWNVDCEDTVHGCCEDTVHGYCEDTVRSNREDTVHGTGNDILYNV